MSNIVFKNSDKSINDILYMIDNDQIDMRPVFQRRRVWGPKQKNNLLASLVSIPTTIPPIYLAINGLNKNGEPKYNVLDGQQRLGAIIDFINGVRGIGIPKTGAGYIKINSRYAGKTFDKLKTRDGWQTDDQGNFIKEDGKKVRKYNIGLQNAFKQIPISVEESMFEMSIDEMAYVFQRLNDGSPLKPVEIRNSIMSPQSEWLRSMVCSLSSLVSAATTTSKRLQDHILIEKLVLLALHYNDQSFDPTNNKSLLGFRNSGLGQIELDNLEESLVWLQTMINNNPNVLKLSVGRDIALSTSLRCICWLKDNKSIDAGKLNSLSTVISTNISSSVINAENHLKSSLGPLSSGKNRTAAYPWKHSYEVFQDTIKYIQNI